MPYHKWDLEQRRQFILIINGSLGVHNSSLVTKHAVASYQHLICYRLSENLNLQYICQDLLRLLQTERGNKVLSRTVPQNSKSRCSCTQPSAGILPFESPPTIHRNSIVTKRLFSLCSPDVSSYLSALSWATLTNHDAVPLPRNALLPTF